MTNRSQIMAHNKHRAPAGCDVLHPSDAFFLKSCIADRKHLIQDQDLRLQMSRDCECETQVHALGISLDRSVKKLIDLCKRDDFIQFPEHFPPLHSQDCAVEENVLSSG